MPPDYAQRLTSNLSSRFVVFEALETTTGHRIRPLTSAAMETTPGDVAIFNHHLYHAVYHKQGSRRYIAMKFAAKPTTPSHFESLNRHFQDVSHLHEIFRHSDRPRVAAMVQPLLGCEGS